KGSTVSQFHSFTKRHGGWGKNSGQWSERRGTVDSREPVAGSGQRDRGTKRQEQGVGKRECKNETGAGRQRGSECGLRLDHGMSMRRKMEMIGKVDGGKFVRVFNGL